MTGTHAAAPRIDASPPRPATLTAAGARSAPKVKIATMYIDQPGGFPSSKPTPVEQLPMGIRMAEKYGVKLVNSIREALCMRDDGTMPPQTGEGADEVAAGEPADAPPQSADAAEESVVAEPEAAAGAVGEAEPPAEAPAAAAPAADPS